MIDDVAIAGRPREVCLTSTPYTVSAIGLLVAAIGFWLIRDGLRRCQSRPNQGA